MLTAERAVAFMIACTVASVFFTRWCISRISSACFSSAFLRSLMSTSMLTAPISVPVSSCSGVGNGRNGTRVPSGPMSEDAPRTARSSFSATAMGHSSCGSGLPSGVKIPFQEPHHSLVLSAGRWPQSSAAASL